MRASSAAEKAGFPTASIVQTSFLGQAQAIAQAMGLPNMAIAEYPGVIMLDSEEEVHRKTLTVLMDDIYKGLTTAIEEKVSRPVEPDPRYIIFRGTLEEVNELFNKRQWTDGLPVIPPTIEKVEEFLKFTDRSPEQIIGELLPERRQATVWNTAVNGVMAGCRPEYMPILVAVVEAITQPGFRIEDAGCTVGWEPLIILNGPIARELDFNYGAGAMRIGRQANSSIGRFLRLYMINIAGMRIPPGQTDKGTISYSFNVALAENEDAVAELGWLPFSVDQGFKPGDNVVTVQSVSCTSPPVYSGGDSPLDHLETIAEVIGRRTMAYWTALGTYTGEFHPLLVISPAVARAIAKGGLTKNDIREYLYKNVKTPAGLVEKLGWQIGLSSLNLCNNVRNGLLPAEYCETTDPARMVPVFIKPGWIGIVVSGDAGRNQSKGYVQNHKHGPPTSKKVELPRDWERLLAEAHSRSQSVMANLFPEA